MESHMFPDYVDSGIGAYDQLYAARPYLWPDRPGRMVRQAVSSRAAGRALDAGCGDGKNALYLAQSGWQVDGFDVSDVALDACRRRLSPVSVSCQIWQDDCRVARVTDDAYDMVVAYGLYHCLDDVGLEAAHARLVSSLKIGGLFVCAAFNNMLPLPANHGTGDLHLRSNDHLESLFAGWRLRNLEKGTIEEDHLPRVGFHRHSLTWAIYEKVA